MMTRGTQTAIIAGVIMITAFVVVGVSKSGIDPKYPRCELGFMGEPDGPCRGAEANKILMSGGF